MIIEFTDREMEALQSILCTADLTRITEDSMPGLSTLMAKVYKWEKRRGFERVEP